MTHLRLVTTSESRTQDPLETMWLAGLMEGEGCWSMRRPRKGNGRIGLTVALQMNDQDMVERAKLIADCGGGIHWRSPRKSENPSWVWQVQALKPAVQLTLRLYPYLGSRRRAKIESLLDELSTIHPAVHSAWSVFWLKPWQPELTQAA